MSMRLLFLCKTNNQGAVKSRNSCTHSVGPTLSHLCEQEEQLGDSLGLFVTMAQSLC